MFHHLDSIHLSDHCSLLDHSFDHYILLRHSIAEEVHDKSLKLLITKLIFLNYFPFRTKQKPKIVIKNCKSKQQPQLIHIVFCT